MRRFFIAEKFDHYITTYISTDVIVHCELNLVYNLEIYKKYLYLWV